MRSYDYRHRVTLEETNVVGNVYFSNHVRWQGRCRELFLLEHAPSVLQSVGDGVVLVTTRVSCAYYEELRPLDEVIVRMSAGALAPSRLTMLFDYLRVNADGSEDLVARGEQEVACLKTDGSRRVAARLPEALVDALRPFLTAAGVAS